MDDRLFPFEVELAAPASAPATSSSSARPTTPAAAPRATARRSTPRRSPSSEPSTGDGAVARPTCVTIETRPRREGTPVPDHLSLVGVDADVAVEQLYAAHWRQLVRLSVLLVHDQQAAPRTSCRTRSSRCTAAGRRLRDPDKALAYLRQAVVNRSRSALRHRAVVERHAAYATAPARGDGRRPARRRPPAATPCATRCSSSPSASARCSCCATTSTWSEARDRRRPRHLARRRQGTRLARRQRRPARPARRPVGGPLMNDRHDPATCSTRSPTTSSRATGSTRSGPPPRPLVARTASRAGGWPAAPGSSPPPS